MLFTAPPLGLDVRDIIGICGTPGTGKKTVAPLVASLAHLPPPLAVNSFAEGEGEVDPALLRRRLLKEDPEGAVLFGHLLPSVLEKREASLVAVLRCEPSVLKARLLERGYPRDKVRENVEAELIGVLLDECLRRFGAAPVREYDTTSSSPSKVALAIAKDAAAAREGRPARPRRGARWIDWTLGYDSSTKLRSLLD